MTSVDRGFALFQRLAEQCFAEGYLLRACDWFVTRPGSRLYLVHVGGYFFDRPAAAGEDLQDCIKQFKFFEKAREYPVGDPVGFRHPTSGSIYFTNPVPDDFC